MKTTFETRKGRLLVIGTTTTWKWRMGQSSVIAYSDKGERRCEKAWKIKGIHPNDWERGQWKRSQDGAVTPSDVVKWLSS